jgi:hypothetical protein
MPLLALVFLPLTLLLFLPWASDAEELRYASAADWRQWDLPLGAVEVTSAGVRPVAVRKDINAGVDAVELGGGIRDVGSNPSTALQVIDGDRTSGWAPVPESGDEGNFIEIDLGRAVSASQVRLVFDSEAPPFEIFDLFLSTGEPQRDDARVPVPGTLVYRVKQRYSSPAGPEVIFDLDPSLPFPIQFIRLEVLKTAAASRLTEVEVDAIGDNITLGVLDKGGSIDILVASEGTASSAVPLGNAVGLLDGLLSTQWRFGRASRGTSDIDARMILDLGSVYWIDQVRLISRILTGRAFEFKFYEVLTSDGSRSPDGTLVWTKHFSGAGSAFNRRQGLADHHFPLIEARFVRIFWKFWDVNCAIDLGGGQSATTIACSAQGITEELQVYGEGFPREVRLRSPLIDLGNEQVINAVNWQGDTPPGTRIEVRSRTGNELDIQVQFHDNNGKVITQRQWERFIPKFRGSVDSSFTTGSDWSPWSRIYSRSGAAFQSPVPRRYAELEVRLVGDDPSRAASIDWIGLDYDPPLALGAAAEIFPTQTEAGVERQFSLFLSAEQTVGFDRIGISSSAPVRFDAAAIDGEPVDVLPLEREDGFGVELARRLDSDQVLELRFSSTVFLHATRFDVFVSDSRRPAVSQRIEAGNATDAVQSSTTAVALPLGGSLFANLDFGAKTITPNGDGANDILRIGLTLINVLEGRPLSLRVYDLSGRTLQTNEVIARAGPQTLEWDGRADGHSVPPGLYIVEVELAGDARQQQIRRVVGVAY